MLSASSTSTLPAKPVVKVRVLTDVSTETAPCAVICKLSAATTVPLLLSSVTAAAELIWTSPRLPELSEPSWMLPVDVLSVMSLVSLLELAVESTVATIAPPASTVMEPLLVVTEVSVMGPV